MISAKVTKRELRSLELFSGAGGLALGTHFAGFRHSGLVEWDRNACETLRVNAARAAIPGADDWRVLEADVREIAFRDFGSMDLVAGGPPCQPFSIGGKHNGHRDERNMIPEYIRAVRETQPQAFIFENVRGLARPAFRTYLTYIELQLQHPDITRRPDEDLVAHLDRLEDVQTAGANGGLRYNVVSRLLNAADYGVPQVRERMFIVGFRSDLKIDWHFPEATHSLDRLLNDQWVSGEYWNTHRVSPTPAPPGRWKNRVRVLINQEVPVAKRWATLREGLSGLPDPRTQGAAGAVANHRYQAGARAYPGHTGSPLDLPSKTLKAGVHGVPGGENMIAFEDGSASSVSHSHKISTSQPASRSARPSRRSRQRFDANFFRQNSRRCGFFGIRVRPHPRCRCQKHP